MRELLINVGDQVYIKSRHSMLELLCTVEIADHYTLKVRLPCKLYGHTHEIVSVKDCRKKKPTQERVENYQPIPSKSPLHNPFRKLIQNLKAETAEEERERLQKEAEQERTKQRAAASTVNDTYQGLSQDEHAFISSLSPADKKAYLELLK